MASSFNKKVAFQIVPLGIFAGKKFDVAILVRIVKNIGKKFIGFDFATAVFL